MYDQTSNDYADAIAQRILQCLSRSLPPSQPLYSSVSPKDGSKEETNRSQRVRVEPERTGWARIYDLVRQVDKDRVADIKEDIDTLLVFVSSLLYAQISKLTYHRPVYSLPLLQHS